ncbi:MAG: T9SS type A sorting domain-containing protein [Candidatus Cloacimonetes bacterium]|nr:T9SS type A sorting domain-containing protein [Candidatus Cloacimonadota bacterium]
MKKFYLLIAVILLSGLLLADTVTLNSGENTVRLLSSDRTSTVLELTIGQFEKESIRIDGSEYNLIQLAGEPKSLTAGAPQLPEVNRSIMIEAQTDAQVKIRRSEYTDIPLTVAPSKGSITRNIDPATVPYTFGSVYGNDAFYPATTVSLSEPYILRDIRGVVVQFKPFVYNPKTQTLRVYTKMVVEIETNGFNPINALSANLNSYSDAFSSIYRNHFLNFTTDRYVSIDEIGSLLVIAPTQYLATMQDFVDWKIQKGMQAELVELSTIGSTAAQIQSFIQTYYNNHPELTFVQLAGDAAQIPTLSHNGGGSDPTFALVAGSDNYPDIFIGRFSAENVTQLETQVQRSIWYERDINTDATWLNNAMGIASDQGGGSQGDMNESDIAHLDLIRTDLLGYGYSTVDQIYDPGASASTVSNNLNQGRGFVNYVGHGSNTSWSTTGFSNTNVNQLTNDYKLPHIVSVACVNGNFVSMTCFAEAWLRAENNNNPTGAIAIYASSINQDWDSPMRAQDEITDLLIAEQKTTIGGLYFNGSCDMLDNYGSVGVDMYKTWHIFGDASLVVRSKTPETMTVSHMPTYFLGAPAFNVTVAGTNNALVSITDNGTLLGSAYTDNTGVASVTLSPAPTAPTTLTVTVTAFNKVTYTADVMAMAAEGAYIVVNNLSFTNTGDAQFGRTGDLSIELENVGVDASGDMNILITSNDPYITIIQDMATATSLNADENIVISNAFTVQISDNVPDLYMIPIEVTVANQEDSWVVSKSLQVNAPAFTIDTYNWTEISGNGNSLYDQGEVWNLQFSVTNTGHAGASNGFTFLNINEPFVTIIPASDPNFIRLGVNSSAIGNFNVAFSSQLPSLSNIDYSYGIESGSYNSDATNSLIVGLTMETFDNGFNTYPYTFVGGNWLIDVAGGHDGPAARSLDIGSSQSTALQVTLNIDMDGVVSFWKRVSSEANYDYLKFYIDNQQMGQWAGNIAWSEESYNVSAGNHTFRWEYTKDWMVDSGDDCVWVDDISFPVAQENPGAPVISIDNQNIDFGAITVGQELASPVIISNSGDEVLLGTITTVSEHFMLRGDDEQSVTSLNFIVDAGDALEFDIVFIPQESGNFSENIAITCDDPNNPLNNILVLGIGQPMSNEENNISYITALNGNYPNPFNPETNIAFSLKERSNVKIDIFNILGKKIDTIVNETLPAGKHTVVWKGQDSRGNSVSSGIYFYRMTSGNYNSTHKMILMK